MKSIITTNDRGRQVLRKMQKHASSGYVFQVSDDGKEKAVAVVADDGSPIGVLYISEYSEDELDEYSPDVLAEEAILWPFPDNEEAFVSQRTVLCAGDIDYADDLVIVVAGILVPGDDEAGTIAQVKRLTIPVVVPHRFKTIYEAAPFVGERETCDDIVHEFMVDGHDHSFRREGTPLLE